MNAFDSDFGKQWGLRINGPVFITSSLLIFAILGFAVVSTKQAESLFGLVQDWITTTFGWYYMLVVGGFLFFVLYIAFSRFGTIRLGKDTDRPAYSNGAWFSMLFSAGMGIGLLFYGVAEPVMHFGNPPVGPGETLAAAKQSLLLTFFHWGLHAWAIYIVVGLSIAYFSYRHGLPLTLRSALVPIIGKTRAAGWPGHMVDIFAVLGTLFGVATSLGYGVVQVNAGLNFLFGVERSTTIQVFLIASITGVATISVISGVNRGIKLLSIGNLMMAGLLLGFVFLLGPTLFIMNVFLQNVGDYLGNIIQLTFETYAFRDDTWKSGWTLLYWAWWISWAPFVGMFIARVSKGRTIREFILGVMIIPSVVTFFWMTVFGNTAIQFAMTDTAPALVEAVTTDLPTALFVLLEQFPVQSITTLLAMVVVITFFVTSSDSGSLVIDIITAGGHLDPPAVQRVYWAGMEGAVAATLLLAGGLGALQTAALATALPFTVVMILLCYSLHKSLNKDYPRPKRPHVVPGEPSTRRPQP